MKYRKKNRKKKYQYKLYIWLIVALAVFIKTEIITMEHFKTAIGLIAVITFLYLFFLHGKKKLKKNRYLHSNLYRIDRMEGTEFEQYLKVHFENLGYSVKTTPATADYGADLICKKNGESIAVQAKRYKDKIGVSAVQQVIGSMHYYGCSQGMVVTNSYFTQNAYDLAAKSNVILWDRDEISRKFRIVHTKVERKETDIE